MSTPAEELQLLRATVLTIAQAIVDEPESLRLETLLGDGETLFRVHSASSDVGKLIGSQGRTARSMRTILGAASVKYGHRFNLDIVTPKDSAH